MRNLLLLLVAFGLGAKRHWHIFLAIATGITLGVLLPVDSTHPATFVHEAFEFFGQLFIRLITMLALPLMISSLITGITSLGDARQLGKIGLKTGFFFFFTMIIASSMAAAVAYFVNPGSYFEPGFIEKLSSQAVNFRPLGTVPHVGESQQFKALLNSPTLYDFKLFLLSAIPDNPFAALSSGSFVPAIFFTVVFGSALAMIGDTARPVVSFFEAIFAATMKIVDWLMILAVPGVFSLAFTVFSHSGFELFSQMMPYILCVLGALAIQAFVIYPILLFVFARVNFLDLYRAVSEALLVAFGTASSSATLPVTLACIERRAGVSNRIASFVLPTGATMNMNGTTIFEVVAVMFLAQLYGIPMEPITIVTIVLLAIVAAIGCAGVPSVGLVTMAIVLNGVGHFEPAQVTAGLSILWSVDRFLDMCRTAVNVIDDSAVATMIAASEGELNRDLLTSKDGWQDVI
jgi:proton glutamate symport protein